MRPERLLPFVADASEPPAADWTPDRRGAEFGHQTRTLGSRTFVLSWANGCSTASPCRRRLSRGAVQVRSQPGQEHMLRLVAQPIHGFRASLRLLPCPRIRDAGRRTLD